MGRTVWDPRDGTNARRALIPGSGGIVVLHAPCSWLCIALKKIWEAGAALRVDELWRFVPEVSG